tara:strand:- start:964 stop:1413 length:450 start_codon:yes stop_codon:yes gene_type:complete
MRKDIKKLEAHHDTLLIAHEYFWDETHEERGYRVKDHKNVFKFDELEFTLVYVTRKEDNYPLLREARAYVHFDNGFYVSIFNALYSYGAEDEYEIAIMDKDGICYDTPLTSDVVGHLDKKGVEKLLKEVSELDFNDRTGTAFPGTDIGL